jgi:hypothetical protein
VLGPVSHTASASISTTPISARRTCSQRLSWTYFAPDFRPWRFRLAERLLVFPGKLALVAYRPQHRQGFASSLCSKSISTPSRRRATLPRSKRVRPRAVRGRRLSNRRDLYHPLEYVAVICSVLPRRLPTDMMSCLIFSLNPHPLIYEAGPKGLDPEGVVEELGRHSCSDLWLTKNPHFTSHSYFPREYSA